MTGPARQGHPFSLDDVRYLSGAAGREALRLADVLELTDRSLLADLGKLRSRTGGPGAATESGPRAAAVLETARLRRRAAAKFGPAAASWLLTETALQQGTPAAVAAHRAGRLVASGVTEMHDLTCSIGVDLAALAAVLPLAVGSDLDPVRVAMARHNLAGHERTGGAAVFVADALTRSSRGLLGYADPARRDAAGRRRIGSLDLVPSVADLDQVHHGRPPVLRMPPGVDYLSLARPGEVEIVSLDGEVKEAVLWPAELASVARRATVLRTGRPVEQLNSDDPEERRCGPAGQFLLDPDGAVVRAGLVTQYAARYGLHRLDPHLAYLSGDVVPPEVRCFRVMETAPLRESVVGEWIRRAGVGTLEILQRGTPVVPDELRRRLRPSLRLGDTAVAATLVVARIGDVAVAHWCRAVSAVRDEPRPAAP